jgi:hypothetical protein
VKIAILMEGKTEEVFLPTLRRFLDKRLPGRMPKLVSHRCNGRVEKGDALRRPVEKHMHTGADAVIALTDVYTGGTDFVDAADAKRKMHEWVGRTERFFGHAAQYEFEAWLLPYWADIQRLAKSGRGAPAVKPELVNHNRPPSVWISEVFETGKSGRSYSKARDAARILRDYDLTIAANACPELKMFLNTILRLCEGQPLE